MTYELQYIINLFNNVRDIIKKILGDDNIYTINVFRLILHR